MTFKKSMISIAAASVIAAGITGCGSSSSGSTGGSTTQPTSITATDGYVLNYTATAYYSDGNDSNQTYGNVVLSDAITKATILDGGVLTKGSATMDLSKDLTISQIENLVRIELSHAAQDTSDAEKLIVATFFDADGNNEFNATAGDVLAPTNFIMKAPAGFKNITPISTLVQARLDTLATDTNDSNRSEVAALALTQIAAALGLKTDDIKNVDPIAVAETNPAYTLVNSMLGDTSPADMTKLATSLASATAPAGDASAKAKSALSNIAASGISNAARFTSAASQMTADMLSSVKTFNLDAMRSNTTGFAPIGLTSTEADLNISSIQVGSVDTAILSSTGAKLGTTYLDDVTVKMTASADTNLTNKSFSLIISVSDQEAWVAGDSNVTQLKITIPLEINSTLDDGSLAVSVGGDVTWTGRDSAMAAFTGEMNASEFTNATGSSGAEGITNGITMGDYSGDASADYKGKLTIKASSILAAIDSNASDKFGWDNDVLAKINIGLVDTDSATNRVAHKDSTDHDSAYVNAYWANNPVTGGKNILAGALIDMRNDVTGAANVAPAHPLTATVGKVSGTGFLADPYIINNNTDLTLSVATSGVDTAEENTTMAFSANSTDFDLNTTTLVKMIKNDAFTTNAAAGTEVNTTSTTAGDLNVTLTTVQTDEFTESNTTKYYFTINRELTYLTAAGTALDINVSGADAAGEVNTTVVSSAVKDIDGNVTTTNNLWIMAVAVNASNLTEGNASVPASQGTVVGTDGYGIVVDVNNTAVAGTGNEPIAGLLKGQIGSDDNITWTFTHADVNITSGLNKNRSSFNVQYRIGDDYDLNATTDKNVTITITN